MIYQDINPQIEFLSSELATIIETTKLIDIVGILNKKSHTITFYHSIDAMKTEDQAELEEFKSIFSNTGRTKLEVSEIVLDKFNNPNKFPLEITLKAFLDDEQTVVFDFVDNSLRGLEPIIFAHEELQYSGDIIESIREVNLSNRQAKKIINSLGVLLSLFRPSDECWQS